MTRQPGIAVVGTGFGARVQVPALRAAGFDVVALVGRDEERTARRASRCNVDRACTDLADALALPNVDAVAIASPPASHAELSLVAIDAGRHVLCEKPFALDSEQATTVLGAAERAGIVHALGHEFRWQPDRVAVANAIRDGAIGAPRMVSSVDFVRLLGNPAFRMPDWYFDSGAGGGWLGASGSHIVDMLRVWLGEFASVSASSCVAAEHGEGSEDSFILQFRMRNGAIGVLQQSGAAWTSTGRTVVSGTRGTLVLEGGRVTLSDETGSRALLPEGGTTAVGATDRLDRLTSHEAMLYQRLGEAFRRAIDGDDPTGDVALPTFADGVAAMAVIDAARHSQRSGTTTDVPVPGR
jgi:predicted dehydrogenase